MKSIVIAGNVGKDAETRQAGDGTVTSWSMAVNDGWGDRKRTIWFDCGMWGGRGEKLAGHIRKGGKMTVSGELSTREHDGKTYLTIRVADVTLQGGQQDGARRGGGGYDPARQAPAGGAGGGSFGGGHNGGGRDADSDCIPF